MSSTRTLTDRIAWTDELRSIELLDWETRPEDFDRLCEFIIAEFSKRDGITRDRLFSVLSENDFRGQVRISAERFTEKFMSLTLFIYQRMKLLVLPKAVKQKKTSMIMTTWPNNSPEPTPFGHRNSAITDNATNTARLSFFR